jgi:molybdenum cofactor biosynthesis enzyme MoaA
MGMQIRTLSIVAGSMACNARCPGCIAGMTPKNGLNNKEPTVNWRNFKKACGFARDGGCSTAMITSKGEPTMFPDQITQFMEHMQPYDFPMIEMQTNGSYIAEGKLVTDEHLKRWYELGLTTIAVSVVSYDAEKNRQIYFPHKTAYFDLPALIAKLHAFGFTVRLTTIMAKGYVDSVAELEKLLAFVREHKVEQLTCTPLTKPAVKELVQVVRMVERGTALSKDEQVRAGIYKWTSEHHVPEDNLAALEKYITSNGDLLLTLEHGARVFDLKGQNLCWSNCITVQPESPVMRSVIFFPDGHLRFTWQHSGSIIF